MPKPTHQNVGLILAEQKQRGGTLYCAFKCPESGTEVRASAAIEPEPEPAPEKPAAGKRGILRGARAALASAVYSSLGRGEAKRVSERTRRRPSEATRVFSAEQVRGAVVRAFESVQERFTWDGGRRSWVISRSKLTDWTQQLVSAPIATEYDQKVMARMLVEIVCADGVVRDEERRFFDQFVDPRLGALETLAKNEHLSAAELASTSAGDVRKTLLMLAWGVALADEELDARESEHIGAMAKDMHVAEAVVAKLRSHAARFLVERSVARAYAGGTPDAEAQAEALALGRRFHLSDGDLERIDREARARADIEEA